MTLAERLFIAACQVALDHANDPTPTIADVRNLAKWALDAEKVFREAERGRLGPLPEPTSGVSRG